MSGRKGIYSSCSEGMLTQKLLTDLLLVKRRQRQKKTILRYNASLLHTANVLGIDKMAVGQLGTNTSGHGFKIVLTFDDRSRCGKWKLSHLL